MGDRLHTASTTLLFAVGILALLTAIPVTYCSLLLLRRPPADVRDQLYDKCVQLLVRHIAAALPTSIFDSVSLTSP